MRAYEEYKQIGLPWLDQIPAHWKIVRNKNVLTSEDETVGNESNKYQLLSLSLHGVIIRDVESGKGKFPKDFDSYKIVKPNRIIFCLFDMDETPRTVGLSTHYGMITGAYDVFHVSGVNEKYIYYYYIALDDVKALKPLYTGLRKVISLDKFLSTSLPLPPREEQDAIVRFLDAKCAKIDSLIKLKERQIALLNEKKQNIINQAVTRGLDPNAPMKDSGVDWIGKIPEGWEMKKVRRCFSSTLGKMLASEAKSPNDTFEKYFCAKDVHFSGIDSSDLKKMWFSEKEKIQFAVEKGDLLVVEGGAGAGGAAIFNEEGSYYIQNSIHRIRAKNGHDNNFLYYWLFALVNRKYIDFACNKATIPHFTGDKLKEMPFPVMPLEEERQICHYLNEKLQSFETIIRNIKREIDLLVEYRARFISDVVTGKINIL